MKRKFTNDDYFAMMKSRVKSAISIANLFDRGDFHVATELISIIRALVHDTSQSVSILKRLEDKNKILFLDTTIDYPDDTFHLQNMLFAAYVMLPGEEIHKRTVLPKYFFEDRSFKVLHFDEWWTNEIFILDGKSYNRKDMILTAAHKNGVLHSDEKVDALYYELANDIRSFAYFTETADIENPETEIESIENSLNSIIRQIAHELISTLINYYELNLDYGPPKEKISIARPIYSLEIAINPDFHEEHKDIIKERKH